VSRLETELRREGFVVRTDEPAFQEALAELFFTRDGAEFTRSFPPDAPGLAETYARFELCVHELLEQTARLRPVPWRAALHDAATRLDRAGVEWFVCGSAALAVRGIDAEPRDVDLGMGDHARTADALADALIEPPLHDDGGGWVAAWFGRAFLGARVEWIADVYPEHGEPSDFGPAAAARLEPVAWDGRTVRVPPLDLQLAVTERRGLHDRAARISSFGP
jgi:hypothetical protein